MALTPKDQLDGDDGGGFLDKFERLYAEGYTPPVQASAPVFAPMATPVLIGLPAAPVAPVLLPAPSGAPVDTGGGVVANSPRRDDGGIAAGAGPGGTVGAPGGPVGPAIERAIPYVPGDGAAPQAPRFDWPRAIIGSILGSLAFAGLMVLIRDKRRRRKGD